MKISGVRIHNFRSIKDQSFTLKDFSLLVGANNCGKSNIIDAIRLFYGKNVKFVTENDFPKFDTTDKNSWVEMEFKLTDHEYKTLDDNYKQPGNKLKLRRCFFENGEVKSDSQSNIYGYKKDELSKDLFYGWKNVAQAKLGNIIYVPATSEVNDYTKLTGPSPFRDLLDFVMTNIETSDAFQSFLSSCNQFMENLHSGQLPQGFSVMDLENLITSELEDWQFRFNIGISELKPKDIIKMMFCPSLTDEYLENKPVDMNYVGQGLQRHLIYALIKASITLPKPQEDPIKNHQFSPDLTLILFEEPEAFLHPLQQETLNRNLCQLAQEENQQVLISTHSPHFVSKNINKLESIIKLNKQSGETLLKQIDEPVMNEIIEGNTDFKKIVDKRNTNGSNQNSAIDEDDEEREKILYMLYLDPDRACSFFADNVLICEGITEKAFIDYLFEQGKISFKEKANIINAGGKYQIPRFMDLFQALGIEFAVLFDGDNDKKNHEAINNYIEEQCHKNGVPVHKFSKDLEDFLGVERVSNKKDYLKPLNLLWKYEHNCIDEKKVRDFISLVESLVALPK
ncbi:MAG TPA: AAA family ATPase [Defluviitaleaceae bacterium]|nr:AAA family ATPase [Defluviitaleaceae bacterium]